MKSSLPDETTLIEHLKLRGSLIIDGKQWYLDKQGHLHYKTIPDLTGAQLSLIKDIPMPKDSLFGSLDA